MSKITLHNMEFFGFHGCLEHEQKLGNTFIVSISLDYDTSLAATTDKLTDALNYQLIYDAVKYEMSVRSNLIEHLCQRISDSLMAQFQQIDILKVRLSKLNPPLGAKVESVCIELETRR